jgi:murein DD-endopeptidase MepM/ murein hydrolase activator NlpD
MMLLRWLFRRKNAEIKIALATLAILLALPVISLVVFASSGFALVGNVLANLNPITHLVEIFDPNGKKVTDLQLSTVWPTRGYVSDEFGAWEQWRKDLKLGPHTGIDIANNYGLSGDPITPFMEGKVSKVDYDGGGTCGIYVRIKHDYNISSLYCHMSVAQVVVGQDVKPGDVIGLMGMTGEATGPHLHFQIEVYDVPVNPRIFMVGEPERSLLHNVLDVAR